MDSTLFQSSHWLTLVREAAQAAPEGGGRFAETLGRVVGANDRMATALLAGIEALAEFADVEAEADKPAADTEAEAVHAAMQAIRPLLQARLQRQLDRLDARMVGDTKCLRCGATAQSQGRRMRPWTSLTGTIELTRRYAYCETCDCGRAQAQEALGLSDSEFTPRFEEVCTLLATTVPHGMAVDLGGKLLGLKLSGRGIQQMTERRAQTLEQRLLVEAKQCNPFDADGLPVEPLPRPVDTVETAPEVAYLEMDGVVPMTREELKGNELSPADRIRQRRAKKAGARGGRGRRYRLVGREVKNAVLYTEDNCVAESTSRGAILEKHYVSHLGGWEQFARLLWVSLLRQGFDRAKRLVVLSDGSEWIRSVCKWLPIPTFLILDLFHVKHRIWEAANLLHGEHTPAARRWAEAQCAHAEAGDAKKVIDTLKCLAPRGSVKSDAVRLLTEYLENNLDRMNYPAYREMGLRVGSGAIESANYHVTGARLKLQGMRWSEQGAREMAYLRADLFNGNWEATTRHLRVS